MSTKLILPDYYRVAECRAGRWSFTKITTTLNTLPIAIDFHDFELLYGISKQQVVNEMAQLKGGQDGFYIANLRRKEYYYCGADTDDVQATARSLGVTN